MSVVRYEPGDNRLMAPLPICEAKRHLSQKGAEFIAKQMRAKGKVVRSYKCPRCKTWHLGGGTYAA